MTDYQRSYLDMLIAVSKVMQANANVWFDRPLCVTHSAQVNDSINEIAKCSGEQQLLAGEGDKNGARKSLHSMLMSTARALKAYATVSANTDLLADASLTDTLLMRSTGMSLLGISKRLSDLCNIHMAALGAYGISPASIADLGDRTNTFSALLGSPAAAIQRRKEAGMRLETHRRQGLQACRMLDYLVPMFEETAPNFVAMYVSARKLRKPAHRKRALQVRISAEGGGPIYNAIVRLPQQKLQRKSTAKGQVYIQHLNPGKHLLEIEAEGFEKHVQEVEVVANERMVVEVGLERG
jgi:hypothetical protein